MGIEYPNNRHGDKQMAKYLKNFLLEDKQVDFLEKEKERTRKSEAEIVRNALDLYSKQPEDSPARK